MVYQLSYYDEMLRKRCLLQSPEKVELTNILMQLNGISSRYSRIVLQEFPGFILTDLSKTPTATRV